MSEARTNSETVDRAAPPQRYFVTVHVAAGQDMVELSRFDVDLIQATAQATDDGSGMSSVEGLLDLDQVGRLVRAGYRVTVEQPDYARSRAHETTSFDEWLKGIGE